MMNEQALKARLQAIAKERNIQFNACWKQLLLERFLARLAGSPHKAQFIFKGGFLLAYMMKIGRETVDIDFLLTKMKASEKELQQVFKTIAASTLKDGFIFSFDKIELLSQPHMTYPGYRIILKAAFATRKDRIQIDIGVGDIVEPKNQEIELFKYRGKPVFEDKVSLLAYPVETIFAEKFETIISKGSANPRMKDYHDLIILIGARGLLNIQELVEAISKTFAHRGTILRLIQFKEDDLETLHRLWAFHLRGIGNTVQDLDLPKDVLVVIEKVNNFLKILDIGIPKEEPNFKSHNLLI